MSQSARNTIAVFASDSFVVTDGVAEGEAVSFMDELMLDDVYKLTNGSSRHALTYVRGEDNGFILAEDTAVGTPGHALYLDCCVTLMGRDSATYEALILVEVEDDEAAEVYLMSLANLRPETDYRLVGADRDTAAAKFGDVPAFALRGAHILRSPLVRRCRLKI